MGPCPGCGALFRRVAGAHLLARWAGEVTSLEPDGSWWAMLVDQLDDEAPAEAAHIPERPPWLTGVGQEFCWTLFLVGRAVEDEQHPRFPDPWTHGQLDEAKRQATHYQELFIDPEDSK